MVARALLVGAHLPPLVLCDGVLGGWRGLVAFVFSGFDGQRALASDGVPLLPANCECKCDTVVSLKGTKNKNRMRVATSLQLSGEFEVPAGFLLAAELGVVLLARRVLGQARRIARKRLGSEELVVTQMQHRVSGCKEKTSTHTPIQEAIITSLSRADAAVPRADGSMASSVSMSARAVGEKSLNVSAILRRYGRCGLNSVTSGSFAFAQ